MTRKSKTPHRVGSIMMADYTAGRRKQIMSPTTANLPLIWMIHSRLAHHLWKVSLWETFELRIFCGNLFYLHFKSKQLKQRYFFSIHLETAEWLHQVLSLVGVLWKEADWSPDINSSCLDLKDDSSVLLHAAVEACRFLVRSRWHKPTFNCHKNSI